jgi:hypothetical protein
VIRPPSPTSDSYYDQQTELATRELSAFVGAVRQLYGPEQAQISAQDWLEALDVMDSPPLSTARDWRAVTVAASARLAARIDTSEYRRNLVTKPR